MRVPQGLYQIQPALRTRGHFQLKQESGEVFIDWVVCGFQASLWKALVENATKRLEFPSRGLDGAIFSLEVTHASKVLFSKALREGSRQIPRKMGRFSSFRHTFCSA
jgi:hypothetical protein